MERRKRNRHLTATIGQMKRSEPSEQKMERAGKEGQYFT